MIADPRQKLAQDFPNLTISDIRKIGEGWDNVAYLVNNQIVFKIPKARSDHMQKDRAKHTRLEAEFLKSMEGKLPVATPKVLYLSTNKDYYGYKFLPGKKMSLDTLNTDEKQKEFVALWVQVAVELESILTQGKARIMGIGHFAYNQYRLQRVNEVIASGLLVGELLGLAKQTAQDYDSLWAGARQVLVHGDLGLGNWIYDQASDSYAVIDWADACIAPQEFQIYRLAADLPGYIDLACDLYKKATGFDVNSNLMFTCGNASQLSIIGEILEQEGPESATVAQKLDEFGKWAELQ